MCLALLEHRERHCEHYAHFAATKKIRLEDRDKAKALRKAAKKKAALAGSDRGALQQNIAARRSLQKQAPGLRPSARPAPCPVPRPVQPVASTSRLPKTLTQVNLSPSNKEQEDDPDPDKEDNVAPES
ncbi:hypothetical protein B0H16DRAFT_1474798 [Mycena metata]|uniref:Uncharacterized protein n=1 Tax=Mycena metata TaxID=1033252 RepID=A0AAD7HFM1_9AGAR|nr:hypothetical protein B0H16DRAFT_1474798 [Mycena metata]